MRYSFHRLTTLQWPTVTLLSEIYEGPFTLWSWRYRPRRLRFRRQIIRPSQSAARKQRMNHADWLENLSLADFIDMERRLRHIVNSLIVVLGCLEVA